AGVIVTNRGDEKNLRERFPHLYMAQIPLGATVKVVKSDRRDEIRLRLGVDPHTLVVAHFGFVNAVKGVDTLFKAAKTAIDHNVPVQLLMLGGRTGSSDSTNLAYVQEMDKLAQDLYIHPYWTGFLSESEVGAYFAAADVVALPFKDGVSLRRTSLQAALSYGCPIITTPPQDTSLPEFEDGVHLLYVPVDDKLALADAFERLWKDPEQRRSLGQNAETAAQQFRWESIAQRTLEFYTTVKHTERKRITSTLTEQF
ncbi:MAG: glycosyltransferase family 4 protein, partial [Anaerolineae bacterium]|nr:glycosyltransferase family 4 protein [Anaerolineae bacterium]